MIISRFGLDDFPAEAFNKLTEKLYACYPVKPESELAIQHQPWFLTWIAVMDGMDCLAKTALLKNSDISDLGERDIIAGYFDSVNSEEVMMLLTSEIQKYAKENGFHSVTGPMNGTTWDQYRLIKPPVNPPFFLDLLHPPFYHSLWQNSGWIPIETYISTEGETQVIAGHLGNSSDRFYNQEIEFAGFDMDRFETELKSIFDLCLISFSGNKFYSPISFDEFLGKYQKIRGIINSDYVVVAKHKGETVGFIFCIPDLFSPQKKRLIIKTLAINPLPEYKGLGSFLTRMIYRKAAGNYETMIHALMHVSNKSANILAKDQKTIQNYDLFRISW
ncbi:MAG: GNAT family N-acetyltransferase [Bacteroidetes bacterium]|nr:GNAT family N-acetyltransferase [Bacteroidota bacterium]